MAPNENITLREMLRMHMTKQEEFQNETNEFRTKMAESLTAIKVHGEYTKTKIESHAKDIDEIKSAGQRQKGFLAALSFLGLTFLADFLRRLFQ